MTRTDRRAGALLLAAAIAAGGCVEERVLDVRGGMQNMPGAKGGIRPDVREEDEQEASWDALLEKYRPEREGYVPVEGRPHRLVSETDPEDVILRLDSPTLLIVQLSECLLAEEWTLLYDQVVSDALKLNYRERFLDPRESMVFLRENRKEVLELLATMPFGEQTPGQRLRIIGPNAYRLVAPGGGALELAYERLDMIIEEGQFRLLRIH